MSDQDSSTPPTRRERRRRQRRRELLDLGLELVRREGLDGLTIHSLAAEAELTAGAIYRYFPSMEAIVAHLEIHALERMAEVVEARLAEWEGDASAPAAAALMRLLVTVEAYIALQEDEPAAFALIRTLVGDPRRRVPDELVGEVLPSVGRLLSLLAALFREAADAGAFTSSAAAGPEPGDSPEARAVTWWATLHGLLQLDKFTSLTPIPVDLGALARRHARALLLGYGARPASLAAAESRLTASPSAGSGNPGSARKSAGARRSAGSKTSTTSTTSTQSRKSGGA